MRLTKTSIIYENPLPVLKSIQSFFPSLCELSNEEILVGHQMGEAFEAVNATSYISRSDTRGSSFSAPKDTGIKGQASSVLHIGNNKVLSFHSLRRDAKKPGILCCLVI